MFEDKETETFFTVIHMFQRSAMANLGLLEHPAGGLHFNFSEAKDIIDILRMLQNKTQGNLDTSAEANESRLTTFGMSCFNDIV